MNEQQELELKPAGTFEDNDPASKAEPSHLITSIPTKREVRIKKPGNINFVTQNGNFPGSRLVYFYMLSGKPYAAGLEKEDFEKFKQQCIDDEVTNTAAAINTFYKYRANLLTVGMWPGNFAESFYVAYTNHLDADEVEYWNKAAEVQSKIMNEWQKLKTEEREAEAAKIKAKREDDKILIELGTKVRDHNIIEKNRELEAEIKELKKQIRKLSKDNGGVDE